jgi:hypothetical protein
VFCLLITDNSMWAINTDAHLFCLTHCYAVILSLSHVCWHYYSTDSSFIFVTFLCHFRQSLLSDLCLVEKQRRAKELFLLINAIKCAAVSLTNNVSILSVELVGRLMRYEKSFPRLKRLLTQCRKDCFLLPLHQCLVDRNDFVTRSFVVKGREGILIPNGQLLVFGNKELNCWYDEVGNCLKSLKVDFTIDWKYNEHLFSRRIPSDMRMTTMFKRFSRYFCGKLDLASGEMELIFDFDYALAEKCEGMEWWNMEFTCYENHILYSSKHGDPRTASIHDEALLIKNQSCKEFSCDVTLCGRYFHFAELNAPNFRIVDLQTNMRHVHNGNKTCEVVKAVCFDNVYVFLVLNLDESGEESESVVFMDLPSDANFLPETLTLNADVPFTDSHSMKKKSRDVHAFISPKKKFILFISDEGYGRIVNCEDKTVKSIKVRRIGVS